VLHFQDKSILEVTFTSELLSMQLVLIGTMLWAHYGDYLMHNRSGSKLGRPWNFYYIGIFIFQVIATSVVCFPDKTVSVYKQLAKECHIQQGLVDISGHLGTSSTGNSPAKSLGSKQHPFLDLPRSGAADAFFHAFLFFLDFPHGENCFHFLFDQILVKIIDSWVF
jgi:hypothetical protein